MLQIAPQADTGARRRPPLPEGLIGDHQAVGYFAAFFGLVRMNLFGRMRGTWHGHTLKLDEAFEYTNGYREERSWLLEFTGVDSFTSSTPDIIGSGQGMQSPQIATHRYLFRMPLGRRRLPVRVRETFTRRDDGGLDYRARLSKWGIPIGTAVITIRRDPNRA